MTTSAPHPFRAAALAAVAIAAVALLAPGRATAAYAWPVKPFHVQHPVRGYFGDPRIGRSEHALHLGIDIAARNGTPVYAVASGQIVFESWRPDVVYLRSGATVYAYWHVVPAVRSGYAVAYRTILGYVEAPWAHLHFAESVNGIHLNPLRPGALAPYRDPTAPTIRGVSADHGRVVVDAFDTTPLRVFPSWWADKPVAPALVEWRSGSGAWRVVVDSRTELAAPFSAVYGGTTRQNRPSVDGRYRFVLGSVSGFARVPSLEVRVADTAGNAAVATFVHSSGAWRADTPL